MHLPDYLVCEHSACLLNEFSRALIYIFFSVVSLGVGTMRYNYCTAWHAAHLFAILNAPTGCVGALSAGGCGGFR